MELEPLEVRPIPGLPGYFARSDGVIFSGKWSRRFRRRGIALATWGPRYLQVKTEHNGKSGRHNVHALVLAAFVGPRPTPKHVARHLDGNPWNNHAVNLAWGTAADNAADRDRHGRTRRGTHNPCAKFSDADLAEIRALYIMGWRQASIAARFGVNQGTISGIVRGRTYHKDGAHYRAVGKGHNEARGLC